MRQKQGFTLIELLVALAIAALLSSALFSTYWYIQRSVTFVQNRITIYSQAMVALYQLEKDISGAFIPSSVIAYHKKQKQQKEQKNTPPEKEQRKPLDKIFYAINKNNMLESLTFIANNISTTYSEQAAVKPKPLLARITYSVQTDEDGRATLYRQESTQLPFDEVKKTRKFKILDQIRSITARFATVVKQEQAEKQAEENVTFKSDWLEEKDKEVTLPIAVEIELVLLDDQKREYEFSIVIPIWFNEFSEQEEKPLGQEQPSQISEIIEELRKKQVSSQPNNKPALLPTIMPKAQQ